MFVTRDGNIYSNDISTGLCIPFIGGKQNIGSKKRPLRSLFNTISWGKRCTTFNTSGCDAVIF